MQTHLIMSPRKPQKFILKIKPQSTIKSPGKQGSTNITLNSFYRSNQHSQNTNRSPIQIRQNKDKKDMFSFCSSKAVCVFSRKINTSSKIVHKLGLFHDETDFIKDQVFIQPNSPRKRRYRVCPKSSHGFRETQRSPLKIGLHTEQSRRLNNLGVEPWESQLERGQLQQIWGN